MKTRFSGGIEFDFSTVPGWAWGIRPMNVVKQTFDYIMDREFEALIAEINHQTHCENLSHEIGQAV